MILSLLMPQPGDMVLVLLQAGLEITSATPNAPKLAGIWQALEPEQN
jgi:hypothetical protein